MAREKPHTAVPCACARTQVPRAAGGRPRRRQPSGPVPILLRGASLSACFETAGQADRPAGQQAQVRQAQWEDGGGWGRGRGRGILAVKQAVGGGGRNGGTPAWAVGCFGLLRVLLVPKFFKRKHNRFDISLPPPPLFPPSFRARRHEKHHKTTTRWASCSPPSRETSGFRTRSSWSSAASASSACWTAR